MYKVLLPIVIGYLLGNFSTSYILGKLIKNKDIRDYGSGNAGATNALRVFGIKIAAITFIFDALKGVLAVVIGRLLMGDEGGLIAGVSVVVGHNWPIFLRFKGGKGIASTIGVILVTNLPLGIISIIIGLFIVIKTKYVSLGSITAMTLLPFIGLIMVKPFNIEFFIFTLILSLMAIYRHRSNIKRLINGNENRIGQNSSKDRR